jgi:AcrR family transcriptional regulator
MTNPAKKSGRRVDRRVLRTQRLLHGALVALVQERGWDAVTVQDVCARADVGRSTFYIHYADKEELLISGFEALKKSLREQAAARDEPLGFTLALLEHTTEYENVVRVLAGTSTAQVVQRAFADVVAELVEEDLARQVPAGPLREAAARYLAGAFCELLRWWGGWGDRRRRAPAVEVDEIFRMLTIPVLRELRRTAR